MRDQVQGPEVLRLFGFNPVTQLDQDCLARVRHGAGKYGSACMSGSMDRSRKYGFIKLL